MSGQEQRPAATEERRVGRSRRERSRTIVLLALAVLITVFAVLNLGDVSVDWIVGSGRAPLIVVIMISLGVGILITYVAERRSGRRR